MKKFDWGVLIKNLTLIFIMVLLILLLIKRCNREVEVVEIHTIDTLIVVKTDTIRETVTEFQWRYRIIYRDVPQEVDTLAILADYFAVRFYERDFEREHLKLSIRDSVSQNQIIYSEMDYELYKDTVFVNIYEKEIIERFKTGFYGHLDVSTVSLSPGISYMNKKGYQIGLGLHIYNTDGVRLSPHLRFSVPL